MKTCSVSRFELTRVERVLDLDFLGDAGGTHRGRDEHSGWERLIVRPSLRLRCRPEHVELGTVSLDGSPLILLLR